MIEIVYGLLKVIVGNSCREESICYQILELLTLIDLFPYWNICFLNHIIAELYFILLKQTQRHLSVRNC